MNAFEDGFLTKCAEVGLSESQAVNLLKVANYNREDKMLLGGGLGGLAGAGIGAMTAPEGKMLRNTLLGGLSGGALGVGAGALAPSPKDFPSHLTLGFGHNGPVEVDLSPTLGAGRAGQRESREALNALMRAATEHGWTMDDVREVLPRIGRE